MKTMDSYAVDKVDVRHMDEVQMARLGVRLLDEERLVFQCTGCGETWTPELDAAGKLPFGYWICPAGCNR